MDFLQLVLVDERILRNSLTIDVVRLLATHDTLDWQRNLGINNIVVVVTDVFTAIVDIKDK